MATRPVTPFITLTPFGGAEEVTGSNFLIEIAKAKVLIDCGIEQGRDFVQSEMYAPFPYDVPSIDSCVITHAHLDHVGRMPKLMKEGFRGSFYMTAPTRDLAELILRDSARILAENARHQGLPLLYEERDVTETLRAIKTVPYREEFEVGPGLSAYLRNTGHILGSASVRFKDESGATFAITSDIGNSPSPLLPDAEPIPDAAVVLVESVYGDRVNTEKEYRVQHLKEVLARALSTGGPVLMPAFSIERTQLMLYELSNMFASGELPEVPVFLDSPLAIGATEIYRKYAKTFFNPDATAELAKEGDLFAFPFLTTTRSREESEKIADTHGSKIIIAGAGMSHGGRIGRWETMYLPDPKTTLVIVGYQAPGSPGRMLQNGAKRVYIERRDVRVRARIETLHGWSGHADRDGLLAFAETCLPNTKTFLVGLGEPASARFLAQRIHDYLGTKAIVLSKGKQYRIGADGVVA